MSGEIIKFQSLSSAVDVSFWQELGKRKINVYQLSDAAVPVFASYTVSTSKNPVGRMSMAGDTSFEEQRRDWNLNHIPSTGTLKNTNTIEEFQALNKNAIITDCGDRIFQAISDGRAVKNPQLLNQFLLVTFADIKTHKFYYWFGFPAIVPSSLSFSYAVFPSFYASAPRDKGTLAIREAFSDGEIHQLLDAWSAFAAKKQGYFVVRVERSSKGEEEKEKTASITLHRIDEYLQLIGIAGENRPSVELLLGFLDPCHLEEAPGWPLRNFLLLAATALNVSSTRVLCFRDVAAAVSRQNATSSPSTTSALADVTYGSIVLSIDMKSTVAPTVPSTASSASATESSSSSSPCSYKVTGWEANARGNMGPRLVDLSSFLDDKMMAASTADLNLKLMRWRMLPQLDLDRMATLKVLLLGSGTLGCNVARALLGWGFRNFTFVDNGKVSYSNPVRQTLFQHVDCIGGGEPKAQTAAKAMERIFPLVKADAVQLTIPMPGHLVSTEQQSAAASQDIQKLHALIAEHDVTFLLTDSRESRWLPTLLCQALDKICINVALGFDSYVVMRHGHALHTSGSRETRAGDKGKAKKKEGAAAAAQEQKETMTATEGGAGAGAGALDPDDYPNDGDDFNAAGVAGAANKSSGLDTPPVRLGCYFCNDVVAPGDSLKDRTLDQQCTVTRPGLSFMASALAVELLVTLLHHPDRQRAGPQMADASANAGLGYLPHQLRGFLSQFNTIPVTGHAYNKCIACSDVVVSTFKQQGTAFVLNVLNAPSLLEDLTGLTQMKNDTDAGMDAWDEEVDEDEDF